MKKLMIKFFLEPYLSPENAKYFHEFICLAEGFKMIGIEFFGNIDYWNPYNKKGGKKF